MKSQWSSVMMTMRRHVLVSGVVILILCNPYIGKAQVSIIQDSDGETSFETFQNTVTLNFGAKEFNGRVFKLIKGGLKGELIGGLGLGLGASNGKTVLLSDSKFNSKGDLSFYIGGRINKGDADWYPLLKAEFTRKSLNLWDSVGAISFNERTVVNSNFQLGVTHTSENYPIWSVALKLGTNDNAGDLTEATVNTVVTNGSSLLVLDETEAVGPSNLFDDEINDFSILTDLLWIKGRVGLPVALRYTIPGSNEKDGFFSIGTGAFVNQSTDKSNVFVGGLLIQDPDVFKSNTDSDFLERLTISIVVGIPLGDAL